MERKSVWLGRRRIYDLISLDGWMLPVVYDRFCRFFMSVIWYSQSGGHSKNTFCDDVQLQSHRWSKMWYTLSASEGCLFKYWLYSQQQQMRRQRESSSLLWMLWWYLRASDQQFAGRHGELSDWSERGTDGEWCFLRRGSCWVSGLREAVVHLLSGLSLPLPSLWILRVLYVLI